ncbi:MAG: right-handed parallel beta-helix repeat-containing protein, partial [Gammaproteobacteria bacterium]
MLWSIGFFSAPAHAGDPVIFYSDLDSGPPQAFVTVWGNDFGAKKGTVMIGSGGVAGSDIQSWRDTKIEFRIAKAGSDGITIRRTDGKTSNALPFTIRAGRIFFVSKANGNNDNDGLAATSSGRGTGPWQDLSPMLSTVSPGDIVYVRTGSYEELLGSTRNANLFIQNKNSGSAGFPIALVSYPGENPLIGGSGPTAAGRALYLKDGVHDWTIAKLRLRAQGAAIAFGGGNNAHIRIVGNTASQIPSHYGTINLKGCTDCKILGNHIYDSGKRGNKLAHLIYYAGFGAGANVEIAWNLLHDEHGGRGIQVFGHTNADRLSGLSIHDNIVYNCPYDGILVGSSDAAYKPWISDALVYNNVVYNSGGGIRINNGGVAAKVFHNTLHNNSISVSLQAARSVEMANNISSLPKRAHLIVASAESLLISHNGY